MVLIAAQVAAELSPRVGIPTVVGEILAGFLLGPSLLGPSLLGVVDARWSSTSSPSSG